MPTPQAHAELRISAAGAYSFNGRPVAEAELATAIRGAKPANADLVVQIEPSPEADLAAVRRAVEAVKSAQARVAFAKELPHLPDQGGPAASGTLETPQ